MASVSPNHTHVSDTIWMRTFGAQEQRQMLDDDLLAGRSVSAVLVSVVGLGLALMSLTLLYVCR